MTGAELDIIRAAAWNLSGRLCSFAKLSGDTDVAGPVPRSFPVRGSVPFAPLLVGFFPLVLLLLLQGIFSRGSQQVRLSWLRLMGFRTRSDQVTEQAVEDGTEANADPHADVSVCG